MESWQLWREMAWESEKTARLAELSGCLRSSASRYYYASYQAITALLLYRGLTPPIMREAWGHYETPLLMKERLGPFIRSKAQRNDLARRYGELYKLRIMSART